MMNFKVSVFLDDEEVKNVSKDMFDIHLEIPQQNFINVSYRGQIIQYPRSN